jgi:two-component system, LytTR family, sensor kinase
MPSSLTSRTFFYHVLAWATFIAYEVSMVQVIRPTQTIWWEYAGYYTVNILLFYIHAHIVLSYAIGKKGMPLLLLLLVPLELCFYLGIEYILEFLLNLIRLRPSPFSFDKPFILGYIWRAVYFLGISTAYWFVRHMIHNKKRINHMEVERLRAEKEKAELEKGLIRSQNAFLQAQISPHLLFNTLNFVYNSVQEVSPKASEGVMLLAEVMHYALKRVQEDGKSDLFYEVEHIEKYIALNQLRFSYPLHLQVQRSGCLSQGKIPPLLLLTFVENVFKHGDLTDPAYPASVAISCQGDYLHFSTHNKKRSQPGNLGHGIGIENARTRLMELYSVMDYAFSIQEDDMLHTVTLKLKL